MAKYTLSKIAGLAVTASILGGCTSPLFKVPQPVQQVQPLPVVAPVPEPAVRYVPPQVASAPAVTPSTVSVEAPVSDPIPVVEVALTQEEIDRQRRAEARERRIEERKRDQAASQTARRDDDDDDDDDRDGGWTPGG